MKTRCPNCNTLYDVDETALAKADYAAICCRCHQLFTAKHLSDISQAHTRTKAQTLLETKDNKQQPPRVSTGLLNDINSEIESVAMAVEKTRQLDDEWAFIDQAQAIDGVGTELRLQDIVEDSPGARSVASTGPAPAARESRKGRAGAGPILALLVLFLLAIVQIIWIYRIQVMHFPWGYDWMSVACEYIDCRFPQGQFIVLERNLTPYPEATSQLELSVTFTNKEPYPQPLPKLLLSFLDHRDTLIAQRVFTPNEYYYPDSPASGIVKPGDKVEIMLNLQSETEQPAGFRLGFL